jgi:hypothetical protein
MGLFKGREEEDLPRWRETMDALPNEMPKTISSARALVETR